MISIFGPSSLVTGLLIGHGLFPNNLHQHPLPPSPVELVIENVFPRAEMQLAARNGDDDFTAHDLAFVVGVGVVFAGAVVVISLG